MNSMTLFSMMYEEKNNPYGKKPDIDLAAIASSWHIAKINQLRCLSSKYA